MGSVRNQAFGERWRGEATAGLRALGLDPPDCLPPRPDLSLVRPILHHAPRRLAATVVPAPLPDHAFWLRRWAERAVAAGALTIDHPAACTLLLEAR